LAPSRGGDTRMKYKNFGAEFKKKHWTKSKDGSCDETITKKAITLSGKIGMTQTLVTPLFWNSFLWRFGANGISLTLFKKHLKTLLFEYRCAAHCNCCFCSPCINLLAILTYLLACLR